MQMGDQRGNCGDLFFCSFLFLLSDRTLSNFRITCFTFGLGFLMCISCSWDLNEDGGFEPSNFSYIESVLDIAADVVFLILADESFNHSYGERNINDTCCIAFQTYILFLYKETYIASILLQKDKLTKSQKMKWNYVDLRLNAEARRGAGIWDSRISKKAYGWWKIPIC